MSNQLSKGQLWGSFLFLGLFFCMPAFYNKFPLLFPDSHNYIVRGFTNTLDDARTWFYSGFVRHVSLAELPWLIVWVQGMLLSITIYLMFRAFYQQQHHRYLFVVYSLLLGSTTAASWHVSHLMPDIFTSIVIMNYCLLLLGHRLSRIEQATAFLLLVMGLGMHNMHFLIALGLTMLLLLGRLWKPWKPIYQQLRITYKRMALIVLCLVSSYLLVCSLHYTRANGLFMATRGSSIFLFARLCDFGIAQAYLDEHCEENATGICSAKEELGQSIQFLWGDSYLNRNRGFHEDNQIYFSNYNKKILTTPKYLKQYIIRSVEATLMQLTTFEQEQPTSDEWILAAIDNHYPVYSIAARSSLQGTKSYAPAIINFKNALQMMVLLGALLALLYLFGGTNNAIEYKAVALIIIMSLLINAFIAGAASGVYPRYQSRIAWLITLPAFWYVHDKFSYFLTTMQTLKKQ